MPDTGPVKYAGLSVSHLGISPHKEKLQAITELRSPRDVTEVRCLLAMVNQMKHLIPDHTCNTWHICQLLLKGAVVKWNEEIEKELQTLKEFVNSPVYMKQFDVNK